MKISNDKNFPLRLRSTRVSRSEGEMGWMEMSDIRCVKIELIGVNCEL